MAQAIHERIKSYILLRGIQQVWLAKETGMNKLNLNQKLNGRVRMSVTDLQKICKALKVEANEFVKML